MIARGLAALSLLSIALALILLTLSSLLGGCTGGSSSPPAPDAGAFCASTFPHGPCVHRDAGVTGDAP